MSCLEEKYVLSHRLLKQNKTEKKLNYVLLGEIRIQGDAMCERANHWTTAALQTV